MLNLQGLLITGGIFSLAYWIVISSEPLEALKYGVLALFLSWLTDLITPNGANVFNNLKTLIIIFVSINILSQAFFNNTLKQDIQISIVAVIINFIFITGGILNV